MAENRQRAAELIEEVIEVLAAPPIGCALLDEPFACILANCFEQMIAPCAGGLAVDHHEGLAHQARQQIEHIAFVDIVTGAHVFGRIE